jgi:SAM-dependent methyltransferase
MTSDATILRFDKGSERYQTDSIKYRKLSADRVSQWIVPVSTDVILDIGCGTGTQLIELGKTIKKGIGIDISTGMVQRANDLLKEMGCANVEFYVGDFLTPEREIPLNKMKINKIISNYALHHLNIADKKRAVEKMIDIAGDSLEMIVVGDLMFFDDPQKYVDQYRQVGYGPENDLPCYAEELVDLFDRSVFTVSLESIHPLAGVLKVVRNIYAV